MDVQWLGVLWKWMKEAGFSTTTSIIIAAAVAVAIYLGRIAKGVREGYGVILEDQKNAAAEMRAQRDRLKEDMDRLERELREERDEKLLALRALHDVRVELANHGVPEVPIIAVVLDNVAARSGLAITPPKEP